MKIEEIKEKWKFTWGEPITFYKIGLYTILSFHPWEVDGCDVKVGVPSEKTSFHGWLEGKDVGESWPSLEVCIIGLVAMQYAGRNNGGIAYRICRMLEAPPYNTEDK